jgi:flagellar motor switch protein FliN/FliY
MALIDRLPASDAANALARALETLLGHDITLHVGEPLVATPVAALLPAGATRSVALPFGNGIAGEVTIVAGEQFAASMQAATPDGSLATAAIPVLQAAADAIEPIIHLQATAEYAGEIATETLLTSVIGDFVIVPIAENEELVACAVIRMVDDSAEVFPAPPPIAPIAEPVSEPAFAHTPAPAQFQVPAPVPTIAVPAAPAPASGAIVLHQFQPLDEHAAGIGPTRPMPLLNDVQMEVTAELGRHRMKVRDLVGLEIGSVIQLDRAAGSPIDVLVNGELIAHGEVVVIDEEFGIRLAEIILGDG